ncbi:MAG: hypothetical protein U1G08_17405 [Verrucomicrobiota bacterium]
MTRLFAAAAALLFFCLPLGCGTPPKGAGAGRYAAVEIDGFSRTSIDLAVQQVCERHAYTKVSQKNDSFTYEKPGSTGQNILWGNLERGVWERIVIKVTRLTEADHFLVTLDAYRIHDHGDSLLEESKKMGSAMQSKYQALVEEIKKLLEPIPPPPEPASK